MPTQLNADVNYLTDKNDEVFYPVTHQKAVVDDNGTPLTQILDNLKPETLTKVTWAQLVELRNNGQLIPGNGYRITDYVATTSQAETMSAMHPFDIIVVALSENTLGEEARAIQHSEGFVSIESQGFVNSENPEGILPYVDTVHMTFSDGVQSLVHRFYTDINDQCWIDNYGNLLASGVSSAEYSSSGDEFTTEDYPYSPQSVEDFGSSWKINYTDYFGASKLSAWKIWYCLDNDTDRFAWAVPGSAFIKATQETAYSNGRYLQRIPWFDNNGSGAGSEDSTYQYAWGTFEDSDDTDPTNFLYSQHESVSVGDSLKSQGYLIEVTEAVTGKGVIYRMIDEWNNDCPYDFKGILFNRYRIYTMNQENVADNYWFATKPYSGSNYTVSLTEHPVYTFSVVETIDSSTRFYPYDTSVEQWRFISDEGVYYKTKDNRVGPCCVNISGNNEEGYNSTRLRLSNNVFIATTGNYGITSEYGEFYGFHENTIGDDSYDNTFCEVEHSTVFRHNCAKNLVIGSDVSFSRSCNYNIFIQCDELHLGFGSNYNFLESVSESNFTSLGRSTIRECQRIIGNIHTNYLNLYRCFNGTIGNACSFCSITGLSNFTVGAYCIYLRIQPLEQTVSGYVNNVNIANGVQGTSDSNRLEITLEKNLSYETRVGLDSNGNLVIHCLEDNNDTIKVFKFTNSYYDAYINDQFDELPSGTYTAISNVIESGKIPVVVLSGEEDDEAYTYTFFLSEDSRQDGYMVFSTLPSFGNVRQININDDNSTSSSSYSTVTSISSSSSNSEYPSAKAVYDLTNNFANMTDEERLEYQARSQYLTFEAAEGGVEITLYRYNSNTSQYTVQVSLNGGAWNSFTSPAYSATDNGVLIGTLAKGDKLRVKSSQTPGDNENSVRGNRFAINGICYVYGNIMSLGYEDNFATQTAIKYDGDYHNLFFGQTDLRFKKYDKLVLPATTLKTECYSDMFHGCTGITEAPTLPATNVLPYCYNAMFMDCSNLSSIKCLGTTFGNYSRSNFAKNTSASGTLYKPTAATWTAGDDGIPSGWEVIDL